MQIFAKCLFKGCKKNVAVKLDNRFPFKIDFLWFPNFCFEGRMKKPRSRSNNTEFSLLNTLPFLTIRLINSYFWKISLIFLKVEKIIYILILQKETKATLFIIW